MKKLVIFLGMLCLMAAAADDCYVCKCKGRLAWDFLFKIYGECGSGWIGGDTGQIVRDISVDIIDRFIPADLRKKIDETGGCEYYRYSGWKCGKTVNGAWPSCMYE